MLSQLRTLRPASNNNASRCCRKLCRQRQHVFFSQTVAMARVKTKPNHRHLPLHKEGMKANSMPLAPWSMSPQERSKRLEMNKLKTSFTGRGETEGGFSVNTSTNLSNKSYNSFHKLVRARFDLLLTESLGMENQTEVYRTVFGIHSMHDFNREVLIFRASLEKACKLARDKGLISRASNPLFFSLRHAFVKGDIQGITTQLRYQFFQSMMRGQFSENIEQTHKKIADFRFPWEWYPATRALRRTIHVHVGPTNSGKTFQALRALENAKTGIYAGPLRLLAHEVYSRFLAKGIPCALFTGEEVRIPEGEDLYFRSCTVEMTPLNARVDVGVIDEIQMISDDDRGWAWAQALLGIQAKEVHVCGEERSVKLIESLCATMGDECIIHRYKRLSPLQPMKHSLRGDFTNLEKGDAIVAFSRISIHALKKTVEKATGKHCAIIYGSLPPETRVQQATLFNDPNSDYDYLVASDAIGMGLNLEIKRVIFEQTNKLTQAGYRLCTTSEIKQIGGRAGRYKTTADVLKPEAKGKTGLVQVAEKKMGYVTTMDDVDLPHIHEAFSREPEPIESAGIMIPPAALERFASYFPSNTPFSFIIMRLRDLAQLSSRFHLCGLKDMVAIAETIQEFPMSVYDRCVLLSAPVSLRDQGGREALRSFAQCVSKMAGGHLLDIHGLNLEILDHTKYTYPEGPSQYLRHLEALHKCITTYLWLSYRYSAIFHSQKMAFHVKTQIEEKINSYLSELDFGGELTRQRRVQTIRKQTKLAQKKKRELEEGLGGEDTDAVRDPIALTG